MTWQINEAFPSKVEGPSLKSTGNEVAVESIELCNEGIVVLM
jgi:phage tail-like protein